MSSLQKSLPLSHRQTDQAIWQIFQQEKDSILDLSWLQVYHLGKKRRANSGLTRRWYVLNVWHNLCHHPPFLAVMTIKYRADVLIGYEGHYRCLPGKCHLEEFIDREAKIWTGILQINKQYSISLIKPLEGLALCGTDVCLCTRSAPLSREKTLLHDLRLRISSELQLRERSKHRKEQGKGQNQDRCLAQ